MALWCSRLARQPVTLEVDGSSPFGVAKKKRKPSKWMAFFFIVPDGREQSNATVRWTVACRRLDGGNTSVFAIGENANESVRDFPIQYHPLGGVIFFSPGRTRTIKCDSPGLTKDIFTGVKCTGYLPSIYRDSLRCSSIYHGSRCRFESHDRRNLSAKQENPLSLK